MEQNYEKINENRREDNVIFLCCGGNFRSGNGGGHYRDFYEFRFYAAKK